MVISVRWFQVPNAGLTLHCLGTGMYGPARSAGLRWLDQHLSDYLVYVSVASGWWGYGPTADFAF